MSTINEKIGKYCLFKKLKTSGMAEIYLARRTGPEQFAKLLVIKKILPYLSENEDFVKMFVREAKIAAQLNHQNIVNVYDFVKVKGSYYIAMEYVRGKNLREMILQISKKKVVLTIEHAVFIISNVLEGLNHAHEKENIKNEPMKIVHRDVSPHNIIVSYEGEIKLLDFGIAKTAQYSGTNAGVLKGKLSYMSPEQACGKTTIDKRSDIFSAGIVLYELLTGAKLFKGDSELSTLKKIKATKIKPPTKINKDIPEKLEDIILKSLAKEADDRYQSTNEMRRELESFLKSEEGPSTRDRLKDFMKGLFETTIKEEEREIREYTEQEDEGESDDETTTTPRKIFSPGPVSRNSEQRSSEDRKKLKVFLMFLLICGIAAVALILVWAIKPDSTHTVDTPLAGRRKAVQSGTDNHVDFDYDSLLAHKTARSIPKRPQPYYKEQVDPKVNLEDTSALERNVATDIYEKKLEDIRKAGMDCFYGLNYDCAIKEFTTYLSIKSDKKDTSRRRYHVKKYLAESYRKIIPKYYFEKKHFEKTGNLIRNFKDSALKYKLGEIPYDISQIEDYLKSEK